MKRLLVAGDSVLWGQGLRESDKLTSRTRAALEKTSGEPVELVSFAHSGAITWPSTAQNAVTTTLSRHISPMPPPPGQVDDAWVDRFGGEPASADAAARSAVGEVPAAAPTIFAQLRGARSVLGPDVDWLIVNGGINDVGVSNIVLPYKRPSDLAARTASFAGTMREVLSYAHRCFPRARIFVTAYFPVVSAATNLARLFELGRAAYAHARQSMPKHAAVQLDSFADMVGATIREEVPAPAHASVDPLGAVRTLMTRLSRAFDDGMRQVLATDVASFNEEMRGDVASLVSVPWKDEHCILADESRLWGIDVSLAPVDPLAPERRAGCETLAKSAIDRFLCERASVGHPNESGARAYADAIASEIERLAPSDRVVREHAR